MVPSSKSSGVSILNKGPTEARKNTKGSRVEALEKGMADYRRYGVSDRMMGKDSIWGGRTKVNREGKGMTNNTKVI